MFVATNEPKESSELVTLRNAGFLTMHDLIKRNSELADINIFQILVTEISIMINGNVYTNNVYKYASLIKATTFLAWGISEIDDVVERERKSLGKTFCVARNDRTTIGEGTWCTLYGRLP